MTDKLYEDNGLEDEDGNEYRKFKDGVPGGLKIAALVATVGYLAAPDAIVVWILLAMFLGAILR